MSIFTIRRCLEQNYIQNRILEKEKGNIILTNPPHIQW